MDRIPNNIAHLGKRLRSYNQGSPSEPITLDFADGSSTTCDLLVGSDGIKSAVRRCMFEKKAAAGKPEMRKYIEPWFSGWVVYRSLVPVEKLTEDGKKHRIFEQPMMVRSVFLAVSCRSTHNVIGTSVLWCPQGAFNRSLCVDIHEDADLHSTS